MLKARKGKATEALCLFDFAAGHWWEGFEWSALIGRNFPNVTAQPSLARPASSFTLICINPIPNYRFFCKYLYISWQHAYFNFCRNNTRCHFIHSSCFIVFLISIHEPQRSTECFNFRCCLLKSTQQFCNLEHVRTSTNCKLHYRNCFSVIW